MLYPLSYHNAPNHMGGGIATYHDEAAPGLRHLLGDAMAFAAYRSGVTPPDELPEACAPTTCTVALGQQASDSDTTRSLTSAVRWIIGPESPLPGFWTQRRPVRMALPPNPSDNAPPIVPTVRLAAATCGLA